MPSKMVQISTNDLVLYEARKELAHDDAYPDVGFGMFPETAIQRGMASLGYTKDDVDYDVIVAQLSNERMRKRW